MSGAAANKNAAAAKTANGNDEFIPLVGGALGLIALGGIAYSIARRRRDNAWRGEWEDEPTVVEHESTVVEPRHDPVVHDEQPAIMAPSAFAWGAAKESPQAEREDGDDRLPGETWVQRAYRGPSANNPSVSLKARLRRAAFFDKRERDVAAGIAEPVNPDAGLPDAMAEERELA
jgi:hypothetical protein